MFFFTVLLKVYWLLPVSPYVDPSGTRSCKIETLISSI